MRLALLIGHFPPGPFGGAEAQAQEWAARLAAHHAVTVVTRRDPRDQPRVEERDGYRVVRTPVSRLPLWRSFADLSAIAAEVRALPERPDLLLCFQTFISGLAGVRLQKELGAPAVVWVRGESEYRLRESWQARLFSPGIWERARGVLVQSEANRAALLVEVERRDPELALRVASRLRVVPNGIELPRRPPPRGAKVLVLGRLIPEKGVDAVIEALVGIPGAELLVAGDGPERSRLAALARARGVEAEFAGFVPREGLPRLFGAARCLVLASRRGEGLPNVLLEAMAWGVPVVATPVAGARDLVREGHNGLIVAPDDRPALAAALARLLTDDILCARLSATGRETAAAYAWERVTPRLEAVLEEWAS